MDYGLRLVGDQVGYCRSVRDEILGLGRNQ